LPSASSATASGRPPSTTFCRPTRISWQIACGRVISTPTRSAATCAACADRADGYQ
jgi:hypothetical protein